MPELIEMEATSSSSSSSSPRTIPPKRLVRKTVTKGYELRGSLNRSIAHGWVIFPVLCYLVVVVGGVMVSISMGNTYAAFDSFCPFTAQGTVYLVNVTASAQVIRKLGNAIPAKLDATWGNKTDCLFVEYGSAVCVIFSGIWIVMVLQCGRGGASRRGFRLPDPWRIVFPTFIGNTVVLILSCIIISLLNSGYDEFCTNVQLSPDTPDPNIRDRNNTCSELLSYYYFQTDKFYTNLLEEYNIAEIGASLQLTGCIIGFLIVVFRCCRGPDFDLYVHREIYYVPAETEDPDVSSASAPICQELEQPGSSTVASTTTTTTVICHQNPLLDLDDEEDVVFDSMNSQTKLVD